MAPVTLRLKSGSGPVTVNGLHLVGKLESNSLLFISLIVICSLLVFVLATLDVR